MRACLVLADSFFPAYEWISTCQPESLILLCGNLSHPHWDHIGDMSTFGASTELVVGPDFKEFFLGKGAANSELGSVQASDVK